jgi:GNAT superfamily N-acetyltransferase
LDDDFEYRKYKPGDETGILLLLKKSFPKWRQRSLDYWRWKYLDSPFGVRVYVAADGDKIICTFCEILLRLKLGDQIIDSLYGDDTATDQDYRGRGVYTKLYQYFAETRAKEGRTFNYWATENPIIAKSSTRYGGMIFPFSLCRMIKIKDVDKYLKNSDRDTLKNKLGFTLLKGSNSLVNLTSPSSKIQNGLSIDRVYKFDEKIDVLWDRIKTDYNYILEKKQDYLNWRYCTNNSDQYQVRQATHGDEVLGYSALRYSEDGERSEGSIMDLLALTSRPDVAEALIDDALTQFEFLGTNSVHCQTIHGHVYQRLLAKKGFIDVSRASNNLIYYTNDHPDFNPKTFSEYSPQTIYFNFY